MSRYHELSRERQEQIREDQARHWVNPYRCNDEAVIRRDLAHDKPRLWRPTFVSDVEKIMHVPYYNRYSDKTQVFSFYRNDDISRRAFHVQLVARIARNICRMLGLNEDLAEAISLGHDIGHTPFGHAGERILNDLYHGHTGRFFNHNVHSVRVLDQMIHRNISLQTLDGIICHNGELELQEYRPRELGTFAEFDQMTERCYVDRGAIKELVPGTLEGCVMRICDIIAYLGKDRQDAMRLNLLPKDSFTAGAIGTSNAEIINNLSVNVIENSYGKPYLKMDDEYFEALRRGKEENYQWIYKNPELDDIYENQIRPMFEALYETLLEQAKEKNKDSILYRHHIQYVKMNNRRQQEPAYEEEQPNQIVVDYLASMTDDYFLALYRELFPKGRYHVEFKDYFE